MPWLDIFAAVVLLVLFISFVPWVWSIFKELNTEPMPSYPEREVIFPKPIPKIFDQETM